MIALRVLAGVCLTVIAVVVWGLILASAGYCMVVDCYAGLP